MDELHVLIADDDDYFRLALSALLRGPLGVSKVEETGSLDEALSRLAQRPDGRWLALFDLSMPGMEGPGTLAAIRRDYPHVRLAVVSASQNRRDVMASLEAGVHGYIPKGVGPQELVRALKVVLSGQIYAPTLLADVSAAQQVGTGQAADSRHAASADSEASTAPAEPAGAVLAVTSPRQREVLALLVKGYSNKQIAQELSLGEGTVKVHVAALLRNLGVANRVSAAAVGAMLLRN